MACSRTAKDTGIRDIVPDRISMLDCLRGNPLFKALAIEDLMTIAERCPSIWYRPGETVVNKGSQ